MTDPKRYANLSARAALCGFELVSAAFGPEDHAYTLIGDQAVYEAPDVQALERLLLDLERRSTLTAGGAPV